MSQSEQNKASPLDAIRDAALRDAGFDTPASQHASSEQDFGDDEEDPTLEGIDGPHAEAGLGNPDGPRFDELGLPAVLCAALNDSGYTSPTTVQAQAIPAALEGADLMVASSTGSGKTAAFLLPALARIAAARGDNSKRREKGKVHGPRVLVLAPTRELAMQVAKAATTYGNHMQGLRVATVVGGVPYAYQLKALKGPLDVLIATPGRLLDHLGTGAAVLTNTDVLVLDEADRMLDMGFIDDIDAIAAAIPAERQTMMFSATFAGHVGALARRLTRDPVSIEVASHTDTHDNIEQRLHLADSLQHKNALLDSLLADTTLDQAVIFTATQRDADILADRLADVGHAVAALHGGMPQGRRNRVLQALRNRQLRLLVATDVAARGIDVPTITHVINYGMPMKAEDYVHRIGRTGRAGRSGLAITLAERRDIGMVRRIERFTTQRIPEAVIAGLEPQLKASSPFKGPRGDKGAPGHRGHRDERGPRYGAHPGFGAGRFEQRNDRGGRGFEPRFNDREQFDAPRDRGFEPRKPFGEREHQGERSFQRDEPRGKSFGNKPFGDRPQGERSFGDRSFGDKPFGQKPFGGKSFGSKSHGGDRPFGDRGDRGSFGDRPQGDKPFGGKPFGHKAGGKPFGDRAERGDRPFGDRPFGDKPAFGDKPFGAKGGKSFGRKSHGGDRPFGDRGGFGDRPQGEKSFGKPFGHKAGGKPGFGGKRPGGFRRED
ncbi:MAG: hypothetical protein RI907_957 [Pseudomonadota bacterium]